MGVAVAQFIPAFLALDTLFRRGSMEPQGLAQRTRRWAGQYAACSLMVGALGAWVQWRSGGATGLLVAPVNLVPWWLLWRFGLRKQLTFLYKHDGGQDATNPDP